MFLTLTFKLQFSSSSPLPQSSLPSQTKAEGMHLSSLHLYSWSLHSSWKWGKWSLRNTKVDPPDSPLSYNPGHNHNSKYKNFRYHKTTFKGRGTRQYLTLCDVCWDTTFNLAIMIKKHGLVQHTKVVQLCLDWLRHDRNAFGDARFETSGDKCQLTTL